jgi:hypothetical protein
VTIEQLNLARIATPFRPFTLQTIEGREYLVDRPECFAYRDRTAVVIGVEGEPWIFDLARLRAIRYLPLDAEEAR